LLGEDGLNEKQEDQPRKMYIGDLLGLADGLEQVRILFGSSRFESKNGVEDFFGRLRDARAILNVKVACQHLV
jgi:hypothetical protein